MKRYDDITEVKAEEELKMAQNDARPSERTLRSSSQSANGAAAASNASLAGPPLVFAALLAAAVLTVARELRK